MCVNSHGTGSQPDHHARGGCRKLHARAAAGGILDQDIKQSIRPGDHVAHAAKLLEHRFLGDDLAAFDLKAQKFLPGQGGDEQVILPSRIAVPAVEADAAGRDGGTVGCDGRVGVGRALLEDARLEPHRGKSPAVIVAFVDHIDLVAAGRAMFGFPKIARHRIEGEAFGIAVAETPDRGNRIGDFDEGIVGRDRAVLIDAMDFAQRRGETLRIDHVVPLADREEQVALAVEQKSRAVMIAGGGVKRGRRAEEFVAVDPCIVANMTAHQHRHGRRREIGRGVAAGRGRDAGLRPRYRRDRSSHYARPHPACRRPGARKPWACP